MSTSEALRLYVDAAPVKATAAPDRLPIRDHRYPPGAWRRAVALPAACQGPNAADRQRDFEARVRALPSPEWLAHWYRRIRADWWRRYSVHAFLRDAAERRIPVYGSHVSGLGCGADRFGDLHPVPQNFFSSDLELDVECGQLFTRHDRRVPLVHGLVFHVAGTTIAPDSPSATRSPPSNRVAKMTT